MGTNSLAKEVTDIIRVLQRDHGATVGMTSKCHWRITVPGRAPLTMSRTPGDRRVVKKILCDINRYWDIQL